MLGNRYNVYELCFYNRYWLGNTSMKSMLRRSTIVRILAGPHKGKRGTIVSTPWIYNWWHTWVTINVGGIIWITIKANQCERTT